MEREDYLKELLEHFVSKGFPNASEMVNAVDESIQYDISSNFDDLTELLFLEFEKSSYNFSRNAWNAYFNCVLSANHGIDFLIYYQINGDKTAEYYTPTKHYLNNGQPYKNIREAQKACRHHWKAFINSYVKYVKNKEKLNDKN